MRRTGVHKRIAGDKVGQCRMCGVHGPLCRGHVVPAFVYRWLKETSATGFLRGGDNPNIRFQDGWQRYWFCSDCEGTISGYESAFAENLFPVVVRDGRVPYRHGPWLSRFLASVAMRAAMLYVEEADSFDMFTAEQKALVPVAIEHWRAFVKGDVPTPGIHNLHFLPLGEIDTVDGPMNLSSYINRYLMRAIEIHVAANDVQAFAYMKMGPAVAFADIQPPPSRFKWQGTRVALKDGYVTGMIKIPDKLHEYLVDRADKVQALESGRSARQRAKIAETMRANPERAAASETFRAVDADVRMFGSDRVWPKSSD